MNLDCATCRRPLPAHTASDFIGAIRFCSPLCVAKWRVAHREAS